jgi:predicted negative regulator of RcsB-dependent stress response
MKSIALYIAVLTVGITQAQGFNTYDSTGDLYDATGDKQKAITYYKKALAFRDFPDTRKKLERK